MSGHTPLRVDGDFVMTAVPGQINYGVATICRNVPHSDANAARLISCWNALGGIAHPEAVPQVIEAARQMVKGCICCEGEGYYEVPCYGCRELGVCNTSTGCPEQRDCEMCSPARAALAALDGAN